MTSTGFSKTLTPRFHSSTQADLESAPVVSVLPRAIENVAHDLHEPIQIAPSTDCMSHLVPWRLSLGRHSRCLWHTNSTAGSAVFSVDQRGARLERGHGRRESAHGDVHGCAIHSAFDRANDRGARHRAYGWTVPAVSGMLGAHPLTQRKRAQLEREQRARWDSRSLRIRNSSLRRNAAARSEASRPPARPVS